MTTLLPSPSPSSPSSPPALALQRVCTVCPVLRFIRVDSINDIVKLAHASDTFRDALESYSATAWRRIASSPDARSLTPFFKCDVFAWIAHNLLTVGQLDVSRMKDHPLLIAAGSGAVEVLRLCVAADPSCINACDKGATALHEASAQGETECVRELLAAGADITVVDEAEGTALHDAAWRCKPDVIRVLAAHPDFAKIRDKGNCDGETALHLASRRNVECVRALLAAGADITIRDGDYSNTALHWAAQRGFVDVVRLLTAHADFAHIRDQRNREGKTAVDIAKTDEIKQLLSQK